MDETYFVLDKAGTVIASTETLQAAVDMAYPARGRVATGFFDGGVFVETEWFVDYTRAV